MAPKKQAGSAEWIDPDDAPKLTAAMLARAEVFQGDSFVRRATAEAAPRRATAKEPRRGRGRPKSAVAKQQISVRLDPDVLEALRAAGPGWQSQINELLRQALRIRKPPAKRVA
jgi:uncharacterized protein (DUF4415 family)